jgi:hypothetical protein
MLLCLCGEQSEVIVQRPEVWLWQRRWNVSEWVLCCDSPEIPESLLVGHRHKKGWVCWVKGPNNKSACPLPPLLWASSQLTQPYGSLVNGSERMPVVTCAAPNNTERLSASNVVIRAIKEYILVGPGMLLLRGGTSSAEVSFGSCRLLVAASKGGLASTALLSVLPMPPSHASINY